MESCVTGARETVAQQDKQEETLRHRTARRLFHKMKANKRVSLSPEGLLEEAETGALCGSAAGAIQDLSESVLE